jgi:GntR family transcriptional regulator, sialic acid-inducible nan operon repressor
MQYGIISRRKIYEDVRDFIAAEIIAGRLIAGESLPSERELMERFGIGRPAIREALLSLQQMGLIEVSNGERARVTEPSASKLITNLSATARYVLSDDNGVRQFQDGRLHFEVSMARLAASEATAEQLTRLESALARNKEAVGDRDQFEETDIAFHMEIVKISGNGLLIGLYQALRGWLAEQINTVVRVKGREKEAVQQHIAIYDSIMRGDRDAAEQTVREHLRWVSERYWLSKQWQIKGKPNVEST